MTLLNAPIPFTGSSARAVIRDTRGRFRGLLAGSHRKGEVRPLTHERLSRRTSGLPPPPLHRMSLQPRSGRNHGAAA